jgi:hypothetical protein
MRKKALRRKPIPKPLTNSFALPSLSKTAG